MKKLLILAASAALTLTASATPVLVGAETSLQTILNNNVVGTSIDVNASQAANDEYFTASLDSSAYLLIEIAGYAPLNAFGIYELGTPSNKQQVFAGSDTGVSGPVTIAVPLSWSAFGFYLQNNTAGYTWYSDPTLNAGGGLDHFVAFQGTAGATLSNGATFDANDYIIAIEDLNLGDQDYNDMVVLVQNVTRVPDGGATLALLGIALCGVHFLRRKSTGK